MTTYVCETGWYGIYVLRATFTIPYKVEAEVLEDGSIYFEFDAEVSLTGYTKSSACGQYVMTKMGLSPSFQIGAGKTCNVTFTTGPDTWIKAPLDKKLETTWDVSECGKTKTVSARGRWKVRVGGNAIKFVRSHCLSRDSEGVYFWFRIENFSRVYIDDYNKDTHYTAHLSDKICSSDQMDMFIKVYIPYAYKVESINFSKNPVNAGEEVEIYATITNLTGEPFTATAKLSAVSRTTNAKIFEVPTKLYIETGTKNYLVGKITYSQEDELIVYLDAYPKSLFVEGVSDTPSKVCYFRVVDKMTCTQISVAKPKATIRIGSIYFEPSQPHVGEEFKVKADITVINSDLDYFVVDLCLYTKSNIGKASVVKCKRYEFRGTGGKVTAEFTYRADKEGEYGIAIAPAGYDNMDWMFVCSNTFVLEFTKTQVTVHTP